MWIGKPSFFWGERARGAREVSRRLSVLTSLLLFSLALVPSNAHGAIMAVDLGSEFLKISIVKPGRIPISIVNNEMSKRKSTAAVAFVQGDRLVGEEAAALSVRYPDRVIHRLRDLLGRPYDDPLLKQMMSEARLPFTIVQAPNRSTVAVQVSESEVYTAEEVVASLLEYAARLATAAADGDLVTDCVLIVPPFWTPSQRRALLEAAELAGLNVMSLVHSHAAASLQYGIERDFTNRTEDVLFYDVGSSSVEAALVRFSSYIPANGKPDAAVSQFEVRDVAWVEHGAGCEQLEASLISHLAQQHARGGDAILTVPRAVAKLRKQVKRTKEMLSANTEAPVSVEELLPGEDFFGRVGREEFETLGKGVWDKVVAPLKTLLQRNNLTGQNLSAVELLGGCSRVPKVKAVLSEALGGRPLDMHMDADEAMVMGAAYFAANLSTVFRLRKFGMADKSPYQISFKIINESSILSNEDDQEGVGPNTELVLVPALKRMPSKRTISLNNVSEDSFAVSLTFNNSVGAALPCCQKAGPLGYFNVSGIKGVISKYNHSGKVALHMGVEQGGEFYIGRAEATVEILKEEVTFTKPPQNPSPKNTTSSIPADQRNVTLDEPNADNSTATNSSVGNQDNLQEEKGGKKITKVVKRTVKVPLRLIGDIEPRGLTLEERLASKKVLRALKQRDEMKRATAKARNDLEAFIISARERVESDKELAAVSTEAEREDIQASLTDAEDWLYGDGETANASEYKDRFSSLLKKVDALDIRAAEKTHRPEAIEMAKSFIELTLKAANAWNQTKPWLNASAVENLVEAATSLKDWLVTKVEEQTKLAAHEDPVLRVGDIKVRIDGLRKTFNRLNNSRPPRPPSKAKKASKEANGTADSADSADSADAEFATKTEKAEEVTVEEDGQHDEL